VYLFSNLRLAEKCFGKEYEEEFMAWESDTSSDSSEEEVRQEDVRDFNVLNDDEILCATRPNESEDET
jgi:hypothetical protein